MSQEKAQLIAPQGHFTVPGLNVAGVVTASSFSGNCTGTASSITKGANVVVGVMTASSFAGDVFGNAAGLSTTTAGLKLGIVTATSFAGNFTGIGSGLTGTPNIVAGLVTASQFVGNTPGLAAGISAGKNLAAGIVTATTFYGDGSNLTGAGSTAFIRQTVRATDSTTTINLNDGNIIYYEGAADTTISIANTSTADDVTIVRSLTPTFSEAYNVSYSTGGVECDGNGDYLSLASSSDFDFGTDDFTIELWAEPDAYSGSPYFFDFRADGSDTGTTNRVVWYIPSSSGKPTFWANGSARIVADSVITLDAWTHLALVRSSGTTTMYINGVAQSTTYSDSIDYGSGGSPLIIGQRQGSYASQSFDGVLSQVRINKGTAVYTSNFLPPSAALTNISGTVLLCCQDSSSTTVGAVKPGTITANGDPSAGSVTVSKSGTNTLNLSTSITWPDSITWNGGSAPTLAGANDYSLTGQVFNLVTSDGGSTWYGYEEVNNTSLSANYNLYSWGHNQQGELGQGNRNVHYSSPTQLPGNWSRLGEGGGNATNQGAIKPDGTLWLTGTNGGGQLGQNTQGSSMSSPVQVGSDTTWARFASLSNVTAAVKTDGTLWSWGSGSYGTLGHNSTTQYSSPVQIPGTTWSTAEYALGGGESDGSALKTDGTLWVWGRNFMGELGQNNRTPYSSPKQIPGSWASAQSEVGYSAFRVNTDGELYAMGSNSNGQLGDNSTTHRSSPVQIPGTTWAATNPKVNGYSTWVIKTDGTLFAWGDNGYGQLGQNNLTKYSSPVQIPGTSWHEVAGMTDGGVVATKTDGTAWSWGLNYAGNLGQNNDAKYSSPVQIPGTDWVRISVQSASVFGLKSS